MNKPQIPQNGIPMDMLANLKSNPTQFLQSKGFSIPQGMNRPDQIIQHLLQSGQITNPKLQQAQQMIQMLNRGR